ncbi:MAG: hypothetical protein P1U50_00915 [Parvibaculaceae bacterium]|nr:hypothetical protein [Parvibaculaceae bacterium]
MTYRNGGLFPISKAGRLELEALHVGSEYFVEAKKKRNGKFHRLYWAMCTLIAEALNGGPGNRTWDSSAVDSTLKIATDHCELIELTETARLNLSLPAGMIPIGVKPCSISFAKMDETQFSAFVQDCMNYVRTTLAPWIEDAPEWRDVRDILTETKKESAQWLAL